MLAPWLYFGYCKSFPNVVISFFAGKDFLYFRKKTLGKEKTPPPAITSGGGAYAFGPKE